MSSVAPERTELAPATIPAYSVHLDAVRGAAASIVFLTHLRYLLVANLSHPEPTLATQPPASTTTTPGTPHGGEVHKDYGHQAVMVFFVLSGYLVGGSVVRALRLNQWKWKSYLIHRLVRLWIVLIPALILGLLLDTIGSNHFAGQATIYSAPLGQGMIQPNLASRLQAPTFFGNLFFLQDIHVPPLGTNVPLWSLTNEFWYYLAFPLLALAVASRGPLWSRLVSFAVLLAILIFVGPKIAAYFPIWLLGVLAALLPLKIPARFQRPAAAIATLVFLAVNVRIRYHEPDILPTDLLVAGLFFLLLYCLLHLRAPMRPGLYRGLSRFFSKISYSLYLTHVPVLCLASAILTQPWSRLPLNLHSAELLLLVAAAVFAVACAVHFAFEARTNDLRRWLEARL